MEVEREDSWQVAEILILSSATLNPIEKSQGFHRDSDELSQWDGGWIQGVDPGGGSRGVGVESRRRKGGGFFEHEQSSRRNK